MLGKCWKNHQRFCPRCKTRKLYKLGDGRRRCSRCGYTFHDFSGRWINSCRLTVSQWLRLTKLFELEVGVRQISEQLGISHNTAYKAVCTLRHAILAQSHDGQQLLKCGGLQPPSNKSTAGRNSSQPIVFGINESNAQAPVSFVSNFHPETISHLGLKAANIGSIIYTDKYKDWDALVFHGTAYAKKGSKANRGVFIDGAKGFWSFAKHRLTQTSGVSQTKFPLYLKELEFRYTNWSNTFDILASCLCSFVPNPEQLGLELHKTS